MKKKLFCEINSARVCAKKMSKQCENIKKKKEKSNERRSVLKKTYTNCKQLNKKKKKKQ